MHHWSARGFFDRNRALWAAFTITTPEGNVYFAGDTGYGNGDYFRAAREKFYPLSPR
jgi:L-ascorbate metabolism protein UlaG (beta-lactamase superfamily)